MALLQRLYAKIGPTLEGDSTQTLETRTDNLSRAAIAGGIGQGCKTSGGKCQQMVAQQ